MAPNPLGMASLFASLGDGQVEIIDKVLFGPRHWRSETLFQPLMVGQPVGAFLVPLGQAFPGFPDLAEVATGDGVQSPRELFGLHLAIGSHIGGYGHPLFIAIVWAAGSWNRVIEAEEAR